MTNQIQNMKRTKYAHLPVHCSFCGHQVLDRDDSTSDPSPCKHTLYITHTEGFIFMADRVESQLQDKGYILESDEQFVVTIEHKEGEDKALSPYELPATLTFEDGLNVECVVGPPSGIVVNVGFAPIDQEE